MMETERFSCTGTCTRTGWLVAGGWRLAGAADVVITVCGTGESESNYGACSSSEVNFLTLYAACVDPIRPCNFYIGDAKLIRYVDTESDVISVIAGSRYAGDADGIGAAATFGDVYGMACTNDGAQLYVADCGQSLLRAVNVRSHAVTTVAGDGTQRFADGIGLECAIYQPRKLAFARPTAHTAPPTAAKPAEPTVLYITSQDGIRQFEIESGRMTTCYRTGSGNSQYFFSGIATTPSGHLVISCLITKSIYSFDPRTTKLERLAGTGSIGFADGPGTAAKFRKPYDLAVVDSERVTYVMDSGNRRVRCVTLPESLFVYRSS